MQQKLLNYFILIEQDELTGTNEPCYSVVCPTLGLADSGDTVEEAKENMKKLISFHLDALRQEGEEIPEERTEQSMIATVQVPFPHVA